MYIVEKYELEEYYSCQINTKISIVSIVNVLFKEINQEIYVINSYHCHNSLYYDYYFNGTDRLWIVSDYLISNKEIFCFYYKKSVKYLVDYTRCLDMKDFKKDCLVIARTYTNSFIKTGGHCDDFDCLSNEYFPKITLGNESFNHKLNFMKIDSFIGCYQIVPNFQWLEFVAKLGVKFIQIRIKNKKIYQIEKEIERSISFARKYNINLFINDYWEFAIKYGAYGVHLGQSDLQQANLEEISRFGIRLGISTHCYHELATACWYNPSYIALGPIFKTYTKNMSFSEQGVELLKKWLRLTDNKIIAIGGINLSNIDSILHLGIDGFAVISAVIDHYNPKGMLLSLLKKASLLVK